ncbi:hypothetical protein AVEN_20446-1 [Araneus ventricosus]|uniref:Uncharacterized protein n=1 Tax=Araneus ventricosus TaxID=182803 RepID=A0A4Y1ZNB2_ARAVE|nr:hypothetical protein AVEN_20446-1 [Araneus ventricosus]
MIRLPLRVVDSVIVAGSWELGGGLGNGGTIQMVKEGPFRLAGGTLFFLQQEQSSRKGIQSLNTGQTTSDS